MMRRFRSGSSKRDDLTELYQSLIGGVGDFHGSQQEVQWLMGAIAHELAYSNDLARTVPASLAPDASTAYNLAFLRSNWERRLFLQTLASLWTNGRSLDSLTHAINRLVGYSFVSQIWQAMPDVSDFGGFTSMNIDSVVGSVVSGSSAIWQSAYAAYKTTWQPMGQITVATSPSDAQCGQFQVTAVTPTGLSWINHAMGLVSGGSYNFLFRQSFSQNNPLASDLNGVANTEIDGYSVSGGTQYAYAPGDRLWSSICKIRVDTVNANTYERKVAEVFLHYALPAWCDYDFAINKFFQVATTSNDPTYATSKLDSTTRLA